MIQVERFLSSISIDHDLFNLFSSFLSDESRHCAVHFVYFPLLSVLLHRWLLHTSFSQLNLILVSGKGQPIDQFSQGVDNSTQFAGHLIEVFVKHTSEYMHLDVHLIHSETNLFRYDENILFVKRELLPVIHEMRRQIVAKKKDKWRDFMRMTLSFADGSSARISAINQSLKIYQYVKASSSIVLCLIIVLFLFCFCLFYLFFILFYFCFCFFFNCYFLTFVFVSILCITIGRRICTFGR